MIVTLIVIVAFSGSVKGTFDESKIGPVFIFQPPSLVEFMNDTGAVVDCSAHGIPEAMIWWTTEDGRTLLRVPKLLLVASNGSLIFFPFAVEDYRQQIHAQTYVCTAKNTFGKVLSRPVRVRAGVRQSYKAQVYDEYVIQGNTAVIKCHIPSYVKDDVVIKSWIRDDNFVIRRSQPTGSRYSILSNGNLHIRNVMESDTYKSYFCQTVHRLTGKTQRSITSGRLVVTRPQNSIPPRLMDNEVRITSSVGSNVELPCAAQGYPVPSYHWLYESKDGNKSPVSRNGRVRQLRGSLFKSNVQQNDSGIYICSVNNTVGSQTSRTELVVVATLNVYITPQKQIVDSGKNATFTCFVTGFPVDEITWRKNGDIITNDGKNTNIEVINGTILRIENLQRADEGMYQCFVSSEEETQQANAQLLLGDVTPMIANHSSDKVLKPGQSVRLFCIASGRPLPMISWFIDDIPLRSTNFARSEELYPTAETVLSRVNVTNIRTEHSATYRCKAENKAGIASSSFRVDVYGKLKVKTPKNVTVVEGHDLWLHCYVTGYPVHSIQWQSAGKLIKKADGVELFKNGTVEMKKVSKVQHEGRYTCVARGVKGDLATGSIWVKVVVKPQISPMALPEHTLEGMQVVIFCSVVRGDQPVSKKWLKDGRPILPELGISVSDNNVYSALEIKSINAIHSGNYSCIAENIAGKTSRTVDLIVEAPPVWKIIPEDKIAYPGENVRFHCKGGGTPAPTSTWKKSIGESYRVLTKTDKSLIFKNGTLTITRVSTEDEGTYICEVRNGLDPGISKRVRLKFGSQPFLTTSSPAITAPSSEPVQLKCQATGAGSMRVTWRKNGNSIENADKRYSISEMKVGMTRTSKVTILHPEHRDTGIYTCILTSAFGNQRRNISLRIIEPPGVIDKAEVVAITNSTWKLTWKDNRRMKSSWFRIQYKNRSEPWTGSVHTVDVRSPELLIKNIPPDVNYEFRISAVNEVGHGPKKEIEFSLSGRKAGLMIFDSPMMSQSNPDASDIPVLLIIVPTVTAALAIAIIIAVAVIVKKKTNQRIPDAKSEKSTADDQFTLRSICVQEEDCARENYKTKTLPRENTIASNGDYGTLNRNDYCHVTGNYIIPYATFPPQQDNKYSMESANFNKRTNV